MRKNMILTSLAMMMAMQEQGIKYNRDEENYREKPKKEPKKVIPKGCQEYVFNESFGTLKVIAMNEKSALKKYNKWCSENEL